MKKLLLAASILLGSHGAASAFTAADASVDTNKVFGYSWLSPCAIKMKLTRDGTEALVQVRSGLLYFLPASFSFIEGRVSNGSELTADIVEQCIGTTVTDFTPVASTGSFATQTHMGFSFKVEDVELSAQSIANVAPVDGTYTFHIGTAPVPDVTPPTVTLTSNEGDTHWGLFTVTATFSEAVTEFAANDVLASNGTIDNFVMMGDRKSATFDVTPVAEGEVLIDIDMFKFSDDAGNANTAAASLTTTVDQTPPIVVLTSNAEDPHSGLFTVTATFSEEVTEFAANDVLASNGNIDNFVMSGDRQSATFDVTPVAEGEVLIDIDMFKFEDDAGNANMAAASLTITVADQTPPTVVLTSNAGDPHSGVFTVTATFSEAVNEFSLRDVSATNGGIRVASFAMSTDRTTATFDVDPLLNNGRVYITVSSFSDDAGNVNTANPSLTVTTDQTAPTVTLTSDAATVQSGVFTVTATFSEAVTGFAAEDIVVTNGTKGALSGSGTTYTMEVTPSADGAVTVNVAADIATDAATNGNTAATELSVTTDQTAPTVAITGPTGVVTEDFTVTAIFSEFVSGFTFEGVSLTNATLVGSIDSSNAPTYTFVVSPTLGTTVEVSISANMAEDEAGNGNTASNVLAVQAGSPASYFEENEDAIREVIVGDALRSLRSNVATNKQLVQGALSRFESGGDTMEFDVDGSLKATSSSAETNGTFFGQTASEDGTALRIVSGDFDLQRDAETGSSTATINGRVAWEAMQSEATLLGYYVGGELAYSNLDDTFSGNQTRVGANVGGYVVQALGEGVFASGFASFGLGSNNLGISDEVIVLESDYITRTATIGGSLTGAYESEGYEFRPELAFSYGKTWIGDVGFTGVAYGLTDTELSLDAGNVILANFTFRPEVILTGGADNGAKFSFAPRFICESRETSTRVSNCGMGAEFGIMHKSEDGLSSTNLRVVRDRVGGGTQTSAMFNLQRKF